MKKTTKKAPASRALQEQLSRLDKTIEILQDTKKEIRSAKQEILRKR